MRRLHLSIVALLVALSLVACGAPSTSDAPTAAPAPTERPTSTPRPTPKPKPTAEPEPTEAPTEEAPTDEPLDQQPTVGPDEPKTATVDMDSLQTYTYKSNIFSIDIPASWSSDDRSSATEVLVRFTDKTENGVVLVDLFEETAKKTDAELSKMLSDYLTSSYKTQTNFSQDKAKPQTDGSILIVWGYDTKVSTGDTIRLLGNSFIEQRDNLISVETLALPSEQFDSHKEAINTILNSYKIDTSVPIGGEAPTAAPTGGQTRDIVIGDLETYSYDTGLFSIDVPNNWTRKDNSKPGEAILLWTDETENGLIVVDLFEEKQKQNQDQLVTFLQNFLKKSFNAQPDFSMNDPKPQSDGSVLIVWSYTATGTGGATTKLLGNSFIEQKDDKISILTTAVPDEQFDKLLDSTNKIINSYKIDSSAALP